MIRKKGKSAHPAVRALSVSRSRFGYAAALALAGTEAIVFRICEAIW